MIYLLGGPPRVGKSTISNAIRQKHALSVVSTDTLGAVLANVLTAEAAPDLFIFDSFNQMPMVERMKLITDEPGVLIDFVRKESQVVWKGVVPFIHSEHDQGRDILIEGVAVHPELVGQLENIPYRVVFIGNQGQHHQENIKKFAEEHAHDWMRDVSNEYVNAFALVVQQMSAAFEREAEKYGFAYIEMDQKSLVDVTGAVMKSFGLRDS